jgi:NAD-dependent DNA ligase
MPQPREQLHELARSVGWQPVDAVTQTLDTLVIPEVSHNSSKVTKAMKYGVNLMTYAEYMAMVEKFKN